MELVGCSEESNSPKPFKFTHPAGMAGIVVRAPKFKKRLQISEASFFFFAYFCNKVCLKQVFFSIQNFKFMVLT